MKPTPLTDRERILTTVIRQLQSSAIMCPRASMYDEASWRREGEDRSYVHFARYRKPVAGDLVLASTGGICEVTIGFYVHALDPSVGGAQIRQIGSNRLCDYSNEDFTPIVGLTKTDLLEGDQYVIYQRVRQAFGRGGEYSYRFGGVDFEGEQLVIWVREVFGGGPSKPSKPFKVTMPWTKRTSVKVILAAMRAGGYGTREFELDETAKPREGQEIRVEIGANHVGVTKVT